jgi:hypothetical protein
LIISVVIGLPIWYFTTTTYRADLPFSVIEELKTSQIEFSISIDLIFFGQKIEKGRLQKFERDVFPHLSKRRHFQFILEGERKESLFLISDSSLANGFRVLYKGKARHADEQELNFAEKSKNLAELDDYLSSSNSNKELKVFFLNPKFIDKFQLTSEIRFLNNIFVNEAEFFISNRLSFKLIESNCLFSFN